MVSDPRLPCVQRASQQQLASQPRVAPSLPGPCCCMRSGLDRTPACAQCLGQPSCTLAPRDHTARSSPEETVVRCPKPARWICDSWPMGGACTGGHLPSFTARVRWAMIRPPKDDPNFDDPAPAHPALRHRQRGLPDTGRVRRIRPLPGARAGHPDRAQPDGGAGTVAGGNRPPDVPTRRGRVGRVRTTFRFRGARTPQRRVSARRWARAPWRRPRSCVAHPLAGRPGRQPAGRSPAARCGRRLAPGGRIAPRADSGLCRGDLAGTDRHSAAAAPAGHRGHPQQRLCHPVHARWLAVGHRAPQRDTAGAQLGRHPDVHAASASRAERHGAADRGARRHRAAVQLSNGSGLPVGDFGRHLADRRAGRLAPAPAVARHAAHAGIDRLLRGSVRHVAHDTSPRTGPAGAGGSADRRRAQRSVPANAHRQSAAAHRLPRHFVALSLRQPHTVPGLGLAARERPGPHQRRVDGPARAGSAAAGHRACDAGPGSKPRDRGNRCAR